jgi:NAD(P)H-hydrate epimerase
MAQHSHRHDRDRPRRRGNADPGFILDRASVREVDRAAIEQFGIPGIVLMENAARALADQALAMVGHALGAEVLIVCGTGNNGGDGWALARHLHNEGLRPVVAALGDPRPESDAGVNCAICRRMKIEEVPIGDLDRHRDAALVVDALFGTGLGRPITGAAADAIEWINASGRPVLAVDVPSGLDCDTGRRLGATVRATVTVTFVGSKPGFETMEAQQWVGEVVIGDIGAPRALVERFGRRRVGEPGDHRRQ